MRGRCSATVDPPRAAIERRRRWGRARIKIRSSVRDLRPRSPVFLPFPLLFRPSGASTIEERRQLRACTPLLEVYYATEDVKGEHTPLIMESCAGVRRVQRVTRFPKDSAISQRIHPCGWQRDFLLSYRILRSFVIQIPFKWMESVWFLRLN